MPQGQFSASDVQPSGRYLPTDVSSAPVGGDEGNLMRFIHRIVQNNPVMAGQGVIGAGGLADVEPGEFHWSDVHPSLRNVVKATADELKKLWPDPGTGLANLVTLVQTAKPVAPETLSAAASAARPIAATTATTAGKVLQNPFAGMFDARLPHAGQFLERLGKVLQGKPQPAAAPLTPAEAAEGSAWREPEPPEAAQAPAQSQPTARPQITHYRDITAPMRMSVPQLGARPTAPTFGGKLSDLASPEPIAQPQPAYPEGIQPRPTDRAEILDDKIARERAANDMGLQLYRAKREIGQESAPAPKWQQVAQAQADLIRQEAEVRAQQVLADAEKAATTSKTLTKTAKAKASAPAESAVPDLNDPEVLMRLLKGSLSNLK